MRFYRKPGEMRISDIVHVTGRGYVFLGIPDPGEELHSGDTVVIRGRSDQYEISAVERLTWVKTIGIILRPNQEAAKLICIGDEILKSEQT